MCLNHPELVHKHSAHLVEFFHMSLGWFDCTEPSLSTSLQGKHGVQGAYGLVWGGSSTSNGSMCLNHPELVHLKCFPCNDVGRIKT